MKRTISQSIAYWAITMGVPTMIALINLILIKELING